jgi:hypothetical protein
LRSDKHSVGVLKAVPGYGWEDAQSRIPLVLQSWEAISYTSADELIHLKLVLLAHFRDMMRYTVLQEIDENVIGNHQHIMERY